MSKDFPIRFGHAFGFLTHNQIAKGCIINGDNLEIAVATAQGCRAIRWLHNTATFLGWIPIIGIIIGLARIIFASRNLVRIENFLKKEFPLRTFTKEQQFWDGMIFKGLLEIACFSFFLPYIDIPATLIRSMQNIDLPKKAYV